MLDFPNNPTTGQLFASGGMTWRWDNTKWTETAGTLALADAPSDGNTYGRRNTAWNSVDAMLAPVAANANAALNDTGRNLVHNGLFTVQQRGAGPWTTNFAYTVDRWELYITGDTNSVYPVALADSARSAIGDEAATWCVETDFTGAATSGNYTQLAQKIENVRRLGGKIVAVSFWATASASLRLDVGLTQNFGTGGSPSAAVGAGSASFTIGTTWARYTASITIPSTSSKTLGTNNDSYTQLAFTFTNGAVWHQSGTFQLWGIQLEVGSIATPLAKRDPQQELALCQRFFQICNDRNFWFYGNTGFGPLDTVYFPVRMRASPTVNATFVNVSNASSMAVYLQQPDFIQFTATVVATGQSGAGWRGVTLSADL